MVQWPSVKAAGAGIARIACVLALGAMLAGCDHCGDWWWAPKGQIQSCKDEVPRQR